MLNSEKWKYFKLEDLFEIETSKNISNKEAEKNPGKIPYVTTRKGNNGIKSWTSIGPFYEGNKITIAGSGQIFSTYYQYKPFTTSQRLYVLSPNYSKFNVYHGIFLSYLISLNKNKYSYGRQAKIADVKNTSIKLPVNSKGEPNWEFMEEYMRKISKGNLEGFNLPKNEKRLKLNDREWDEFRLEDLFEIERGKRLIKKDRVSGDVPYMSASEINNGITDKISNPLFIKKQSLCLTTFGDAFYHEQEFTASDEVTILKNKYLNNYVGLFMVGILQHQKYRYSFGRKLYYNKIKYITIKLPIKPKSSPDEKSEPDWEFMENYIKGLPYTNKL